MPMIGFLHSASLEPNAKRLAGFRKGLQQAGFIEGQNVVIEYRWAEGQNARLPELAAELIRKPEVDTRLRELQLDPLGSTPAEAVKFFAEETALWSKVIKDANVKVE